jgi:23S rRNA (cytosine1962-C5)-methyltransferase
MRQSGGLSDGALVTSIDSSAPAIAKAQANVTRNGFDADRQVFMDADVNASLRALHKEGKQFDGIVLDPPKFAPSAAHADRAARAYKDINRWAFKLLAPGGVLSTGTVSQNRGICGYGCGGGCLHTRAVTGRTRPSDDGEFP